MAYGTNAPLGLVPVRYLNGTSWNGALTEYPIASGYATSLFTGDPVLPLADGTIGVGTAGAVCLGVFAGCRYTDTNGVLQYKKHWVASTTVMTGTTAFAQIIDDPNMVFSIQETDGSGAAGTPLVLTAVNLNLNFYRPAATAAQLMTGTSLASLDNSTEATTSTLNFRLLGLDTRPGNVVGNFANWLVTWNSHALKSVGTAGV
jgi:hypothetical protein